MPTTKLGSTSHTATNELLMKHFEVDQKINEVLSAVEYETKVMLATRLQGLIDEVKAEQKARTEVL